MKQSKQTREDAVSLPVQSALIPVFYKKFHCLAQNCKDSCCVNWNITFNKKDYLKLRRLDVSPELQEKLKNCVRRERNQSHSALDYGKFDLDSNNGRCPFLDKDGLCSIQRACGENALPNVCRTYPRNITYTSVAKEFTLSPSCEGVLQQLWDLPEGIEFVEDPLTTAEYRSVSIPAGENLVLFFEPIRASCIDILQNRELTLSQRMLYLGIMLDQLRREEWSTFDPDIWTKRVSSLVNPDKVLELTEENSRKLFLLQNLNVLKNIAVSEKNWPIEIYKALETKLEIMQTKSNSEVTSKLLSTEFSVSAYEDALLSFEAAFSEREYFFENLIVAAALFLKFPKLSSKENLWKSYMSLCSLYSFYRFVSVLGCKSEPTKERLFYFLVMASRSTLHNRARFNKFQEELFQHDSSTLAHMAILLSN